jgi:hypothetical protein
MLGLRSARDAQHAATSEVGRRKAYRGHERAPIRRVEQSRRLGRANRCAFGTSPQQFDDYFGNVPVQVAQVSGLGHQSARGWFSIQGLA